MDRESSKGLKITCKGFTPYLGFYKGQCAYLDTSRGRLNFNLLRSTWLSGVEPGARFDSHQLQCKDLILPREVGIFFLFPGLIWKGVLPSLSDMDVRQNP